MRRLGGAVLQINLFKSTKKKTVLLSQGGFLIAPLIKEGVVKVGKDGGLETELT